MNDENRPQSLVAHCAECAPKDPLDPASWKEIPLAPINPLDGLTIALQSIAADLHVLRTTMQLAFGTVFEKKMTQEELQAEIQANPRSVQAGYMHHWINAQLNLLQASQEAQLQRMGEQLKVYPGPKNGGRRR